MGRKSDNKNLIIETAAMLFWERGYESVGVNAVCEEANINKGTLYHFFANKQSLVLAVIERNSNLTLGYVRQLEKQPAKERVLAYLNMIIAVQTEEFNSSGRVAGCPFGNLSAEMAGKDEKIRKAVLQWSLKMIEFFTLAIQETHINEQDAKSLATKFFTYLQGSLLMSKTVNSIQPLEIFRSYASDLFDR